jgi:hypothetical protein
MGIAGNAMSVLNVSPSDDDAAMDHQPHTWPLRTPARYLKQIIGGRCVEKRLQSKEWCDSNPDTVAKLDGLMTRFERDYREEGEVCTRIFGETRLRAKQSAGTGHYCSRLWDQSVSHRLTISDKVIG